MSIQHFDASRIKKTNWSGGTTSELFIFPEGSEFNIGNYLFRLSIATVEIEESTFTRLPDVNRTLMVLEGILKLEHEGHHKATLKPLEFDNFKGDWNTKSWGKVTNFNQYYNFRKNTQENISNCVTGHFTSKMVLRDAMMDVHIHIYKVTYI